MAASTCLPQSSLPYADLCEGQRKLQSLSPPISRHEASKFATLPSDFLVNRPSESSTAFTIALRKSAPAKSHSHDASSIDQEPQLSRTSLQQVEGMGRLPKARPCGESQLSRPGPKISLSTSNGTIGTTAESSSSAPSRYDEFKLRDLQL